MPTWLFIDTGELVPCATECKDSPSNNVWLDLVAYNRLRRVTKKKWQEYAPHNPIQSRQSHGVVGGCQSLTHPQLQQIQKWGNKWIKT